jgi:16S rRNA (cytidine1402-2'-O)-methyltransferase
MLNEHENESLQEATNLFKQGLKIGLISEAGCPNVADPGQQLVSIAHENDVKVIPHVGPNSILLALMASGFNGQQFHFHGYLPNKQPMLSQKITELERESKLKNCTQIFIETPYRNHQIIQEMMKVCNANTKLCIACNITGNDESIISLSISQWKQRELNFHKKPAVFLLYSF